MSSDVVLNRLPVMMYRRTHDESGSFLFVSPGCLAVTGYSAVAMVSQSMRLASLVVGDEWDSVAAGLRSSSKGNGEYGVAYCIRTRGGTQKWIWDCGRVVESDTDPPIHLDGVMLDISALKAETDPFTGEWSMLRSLVESVPDMLTIVDLDGTIRFQNHTPDAATPTALIGTRVYDHLPPDMIERGRRWIEQVVHTREPLDVEVRDRNGRWCASRLGPILRDGKVVGLTAVTTDITTRRNAEEQLRFTQFVVDHMRDATFWVTPDARFCYVNEAACRKFGYTRDELMQMTVHDIDPGFPKETWASEWRRIQGQGVEIVESQHRTKDGRLIPVEITVNAVEFNDRRFNCAVVRDITERKQYDAALHRAKQELEQRVRERTSDLELANQGLRQEVARRGHVERALRESEDRFRQLTEHLHEVVWLVSSDQRELLYVSAAYETVWGRTIESLYRDPLSWIEAVHPEERERVAAAYAGLPSSGSFDVEYRIIRPAGEIRWIHDRGFPIRNEKGVIDRLCGLCADITDRKQAEYRLRQNLDQLTHFSRLSTMGEMAATLAHELNQPLAAIANYSRACVRMLGAPGLDLKRLAEGMEKTAEQAIRAGGIIQRMRRFARRETQPPTRVDVNHLVRESIDFIEAEARLHQIRIRLELADGLPPIHVDPIQITQVIVNLERNAVEAMVDVSPQTRELIIHTLRSPTTDDSIELCFLDTGCGIPAGNLERVFEPFFTTKPAGMGMGLTICRSIVENCGGTVVAEPNHEPGSAFRVVLPAVK